MEFEVIEPSGRSGGLFYAWDTGSFSKVECVKEENFMVIKGRIKGVDDYVFLTNVYAPQKTREKRVVWNALEAIRNRSPGYWFLLGDFNTVRNADERKGSRFKRSCANDFNEFIEKTDLHEYEMKGSKFTYVKEDERGVKLRKIDRCLVSRNVIDTWPEACLRSLPRLYSDHNPNLLAVMDLNFGPKPSHFFNSWLESTDCEEVVDKALASFVPHGSPDVNLMRKFRWLRQHLKQWRDEVLSKEGEGAEIYKKELEEVDLQMEVDELSKDKQWARFECKKKIGEFEDRKVKDLR